MQRSRSQKRREGRAQPHLPSCFSQTPRDIAPSLLGKNEKDGSSKTYSAIPKKLSKVEHWKREGEWMVPLILMQKYHEKYWYPVNESYLKIQHSIYMHRWKIIDKTLKYIKVIHSIC